MEIEGRIAAKRGDDRHARLDDHAHDLPEQARRCLRRWRYWRASTPRWRGQRLASARNFPDHCISRYRRPARAWPREPRGRGRSRFHWRRCVPRPCRPRWRSMASGPTKGTVEGRALISGVKREKADILDAIFPNYVARRSTIGAWRAVVQGRKSLMLTPIAACRALQAPRCCRS